MLPNYCIRIQLFFKLSIRESGMTVSFRRKNVFTYGWTPYSPYAKHCLMHVVSIKATLKTRKSKAQEKALPLLQDNLEINLVRLGKKVFAICRKILHIFSKKNQQNGGTYFYQSFLLIISAILTL